MKNWTSQQKLTALAGGAIVVAVAVIAVVLLAGGGGGSGNSGGGILSGGAGGGAKAPPLPAGDLGLALKPNVSDALGVDPAKGFTLTSGQDLSVAQVTTSLKLTPSGQVNVEAVSKRSFKVTPVNPPAPDAAGKIVFVEPASGATVASWAYQVRSPLHIVSTLPADQRTSIALDTGIEVTFSADDVVNPQAAFSITPQVNGRFEQHKRTLVFVPSALTPQTLYTVTVKAGVKVNGSDSTLEQPLTFQFETAQNRGGPPAPTLSFSHIMSEVATAEAPLLAIQTQDLTTKQLTVALYLYPDQKTFVTDLAKLDTLPTWSQFGRDNLGVDVGPLKLASTITATVEDVRDPKSTNFFSTQPYIRFPAPLPAGAYLLQTQYGGRTLQAWLQVTDVATFVSLSEGKALVWANDVAAGAPLGGAKIELVGGSAALGTTNDQGVLQFDTPASVSTVTKSFGSSVRTAKGIIVVTDSKGRSAVVPLNPAAANNNYNSNRGDYSITPSRDYWHFIATDRPIYQPTDTVHVWGVAKAREGDPKRDLRLELRYNGDKVVGMPTKVTTDELGAFQADVPLEGLGGSYYNLYLVDAGGGAIDTAYFQVSQYVKPAYRIAVTPSKVALLAGEEYDVEVKATFYDGTPVAGVGLKYSMNNGKASDAKTLTTDQNGVAKVHATAALQQDQSTNAYEGQTINVTPDRSEEGEISGSISIIVFPSSVALRAGGIIKVGNATVSGDLSNIDLNLFSAGLQRALYGFSGYNVLTSGKKPAFLTTPVANAQLSIDVAELRYSRNEIGERYDFINKVTVKVYDYKQQRFPLPKASATTNAQGQFSYSFAAANKDSSYEITITAKDAQGRSVSQRTYAYSGTERLGPNGTYSTIAYADTTLDFSKRWAVGDKVPLSFQRGDTSMPSGGKNHYLFYEAQRGIKRFAVQDNPAYTSSFVAEDVPSVSVTGVYFNGSTYIESATTVTLRFDSSSRRLNLNLTPGKQSYAPGDEAVVQIAVTDAAGKPVQAEVNLAAVDEAVFDVSQFGDVTGEIVEDLYTSVPSGIFRTYVSHQYPVSLDGAGGRGGGGDNGRNDFQDVAFFGSVRTDASGKAEIKFKLPDNLTSWRVTAYALTADLQAASAKALVPVSQPFFVDVSLNDDYLTTDKPVLRLRGYGAGIKDGDPVQVSVTAPSLGLTQPTTASGKAFEGINVALPDLKAGQHDIRVEATSGSRKDVVTRRITVLPSRLVTPVLDSKDAMKAGDTLKGATDTQTSVVFADAGRGRLLPSLQRLRYSYGDRLDQTMARVLSAQWLNKYFGQKVTVEDLPADLYSSSPPPAPGAPSTTVSQIKGVAILPYASPDLEVTALAAALQPDVFGLSKAAPYLQATLDNSKETNERYAVALFGLASLGQPVLLQAQALAAAPDLGWRGRLNLALAFKALGDDPSARTMMAALSKEFNEDQTPNKRLRVGTDQDDVIEATALMSALAAGYDDAAADAYYRYLALNQPKDRPVYLIQLLYLKSALERSGAGGVKFDYTVDGKRQSATLEGGKTLSISLSPSQITGLRIESVEGALSATSTYLAPLIPQLQKPSPDLTIKRSYVMLGKPSPAGAPLTQDALVEVSIDVTFGAQAANDCYQVTDLLPSGLKPVTRSSWLTNPTGGPPQPRGTAVIRPNLVNGQRVTFCVSRTGATHFTYYARPTNAGVFTWEPAQINARSTPSVAALTPASTVEIK